MIASDFPDLGAEDLAAQVRASAAEYHAARTAAGGSDAPLTSTTNGAQHSPNDDYALPPLVLQPDFRPNADARYHVNDLLAFHDRHFVQNAFQVLHRRAPDQVELNEYLTALRGGRLTKFEILEALHAAGGRQGQEVRVGGLARRGAKGLARRLTHVPVFGRLLRLLRALWRIPLLIEHQGRFEAYALGQQQEIVSYLNLALERILQQQRQIFARQERLVAQQQNARELQERTQAEVARLVAGFAGIANLSEIVGETAAVTGQTAAAVARLSADIARVSDGTAHTAAAISAMFDDLAGASESIVMLADVLAGLAAHSPELAMPERLLRKQHEIESLAKSLSGAQAATAAANRELIVQEQFFIVEAQKAALAEVQSQLRELREQQQLAAVSTASQQEDSGGSSSRAGDQGRG